MGRCSGRRSKRVFRSARCSPELIFRNMLKWYRLGWRIAGFGGHLRLTLRYEKEREVITVQVSAIKISTARLDPEVSTAKPGIWMRGSATRWFAYEAINITQPRGAGASGSNEALGSKRSWWQEYRELAQYFTRIPRMRNNYGRLCLSKVALFQD